MKPYKYILLIFSIVLFSNSSCKYEEGQRFIIKNNSDKDIVVIFSTNGPVNQFPTCIKPTTSYEYEQMVYQSVVFPNSEKNFERRRFGESLKTNPNLTLNIGIFYLDDVNTMSCKEFVQLFPLKKEWEVTLEDMEACDWTLVYTPD